MSPCKEARAKRDEARRQLAGGVDPAAQRKATKTAEADTFKALYLEWKDKFSPGWAPSHEEAISRRIEKNVLPYRGFC